MKLSLWQNQQNQNRNKPVFKWTQGAKKLKMKKTKPTKQTPRIQKISEVQVKQLVAVVQIKLTR